MAKMFYTMDETRTALGKSEDEIKQLAKDGRLREFKDGTRLMFKTDQVEQLKRELGDSSEPLGLAEDDSVIGLAGGPDIASSSATGITLVDSGSLGGSKVGSKVGTKTGSKSGSTAGGIAVAGGSVAGSNPSDDTALAADLGLSGSVSGVPSSGRAAGSSAGTRGGIDIFQSDEGEKADPSAQTSIAPGLGGDQINIESVGSGSGLLDLTRESDDTSLGASELMDEIAPGASGVRRAAESSLSASALTGSSIGGSGGPSMGDLPSAAPSSRQAPPIVEAADPLAPAFGLAAVGAAAVILFAAFALMCGLAGDQPVLLKKLDGMGFLVVLGLTFVLPVLLFVGGLLSGKVSRK